MKLRPNAQSQQRQRIWTLHRTYWLDRGWAWSGGSSTSGSLQSWMQRQERRLNLRLTLHWQRAGLCAAQRGRVCGKGGCSCSSIVTNSEGYQIAGCGRDSWSCLHCLVHNIHDMPFKEGRKSIGTHSDITTCFQQDEMQMGNDVLCQGSPALCEGENMQNIKPFLEHYLLKPWCNDYAKIFPWRVIPLWLYLMLRLAI